MNGICSRALRLRPQAPGGQVAVREKAARRRGFNTLSRQKDAFRRQHLGQQNQGEGVFSKSSSYLPSVGPLPSLVPADGLRPDLTLSSSLFSPPWSILGDRDHLSCHSPSLLGCLFLYIHAPLLSPAAVSVCQSVHLPRHRSRRVLSADAPLKCPTLPTGAYIYLLPLYALRTLLAGNIVPGASFRAP